MNEFMVTVKAIVLAEDETEARRLAGEIEKVADYQATGRLITVEQIDVAAYDPQADVAEFEELGAVATINRPVAFPGTAEEAEANYRTHDWIVESPEEPLRCLACDSKEWHVAASYPCGVEPPRETVTI